MENINTLTMFSSLNKKPHNYIIAKFLICFTVTVLLLFFLYGLFININNSLSTPWITESSFTKKITENLSRLGSVGDYFGGMLNPIISIIGFVLILVNMQSTKNKDDFEKNRNLFIDVLNHLKKLDDQLLNDKDINLDQIKKNFIADNYSESSLTTKLNYFKKLDIILKFANSNLNIHVEMYEIFALYISEEVIYIIKKRKNEISNYKFVDYLYNSYYQEINHD